jgi:hypothetical protein
MDKQEFSATYLLLRAKSMPEAYNTSPPSIAPGGFTSEMWIPNCFKASRMASSSPCREAAPWHKFRIRSSVPQINYDPNAFPCNIKAAFIKPANAKFYEAAIQDA